MRIVYMGTPDIAADVLKELLGMKEISEIVGVFTQPDKPVGRKQILTPSPVKELALSEGIPVFQPRRIKKEKPVAELKALDPDLIIVTAYGQILSEEILNIPPMGCINMHASLLPKYRGAAPIQWSIVRGEKMTGVTAMQMDKGMDTGDILLQKEVEICPDETEESLLQKLSLAGRGLIREVVEKLAEGQSLPREKQEESKATYAPIIVKEDGLIDWGKSAGDIDRMVRGFHVWPGAYTSFEGKKLTILESGISTETKDPAPEAGSIYPEAAAGKKPRFLVQTGCGVLEIRKLQLQGKKAMASADFLRGVRQIPEKLGE
ncbi:MAG: methionyl-tRNA formyltransferase [Firmicutes bacterium]|nr:methionyl-tRNA formyltransferase [Bacillota bacterium]